MVLVYVVLAVLAAGEPPADARWQRIDRAADRVLDGRFQRRMPGEEDEVKPGAGGAHAPRRHGDLRAAPPPGQRWAARDEGSPLGRLAQWILWGAIGIAIFLAVLSLVGALSRGDRDIEPVAGKSPDAPGIDRAVIERPLGDADELARQGRFAEAIHTLLLRTLQELARTSSMRLQASMTSREILSRVPLLGDARVALSGLVTAVELTHFGDDVPGAPDYERCRDQFHVFASAYRRGGGVAA